MQKINVLGTEYTILYGTEYQYSKLKDSTGCCDTSVKKIYISDMSEEKKENDSLEDLEEYKKHVLRHEIVHAMFYESGLNNNSDYAANEELVDWIAIQLPKLVKIMQSLNII